MKILEQLEEARVKLNRLVEQSTPEMKEELAPKMQELNKTIIEGTKEINSSINGNSSK